MRHSLYVVPLVLLLYCASVCVAVLGLQCGFNVIKKRRGNISVAVVREVPAKGQGAWQAYTAAVFDTWAPIRIFVSTLDLSNTDMYCTERGQRRPDFIGGRWFCQDEQILTNAKKRALLDHILPTALKLHEERLLVKPMNGAFKVPEFDRHEMCSKFSVPREHRGPGFSGYDTVMYVAAGPSRDGGNVAWGVLCALLDSRRPVVGAMYFEPSRIIATSEMVRVAAHEMAHVLGFDRDVFYNANMITTTPGTRGKSTAFFLSSAKAVEKAREHYNCSTAPGIELEDNGGDATALSHWERRNAKDELMAGITGIGYYTALTMAAFEGTTYYRANWGMEETMSWGKDAGCGFLMEKCVENNISKYPEFFCSAPSKRPECTSDRLALGACFLFEQPQNLPHVYQYFTDPKIGGYHFGLMDFCPVVLPWRDVFCHGDNKNGWPWIRTGPLSWCLKGESLEQHGNSIGDVCAEVWCENESVRVRYYGDDEWYPCPEGSVLTPRKTFTNGSIVCPKYREVCTLAPDGSSRVTSRNKSEVNNGNSAAGIRYSSGEGAMIDSTKQNVKGNDVASSVGTDGLDKVGTLVQGETTGTGGAPSVVPLRREREKHGIARNVASTHVGGAIGGAYVSVASALFTSVFILIAALSH